MQYSIEYNKKPGKIATVKVVKDPATPPNIDNYKSHTIHTSPGEPPSSVSKPTPRPKQVAARPVTTGKLLRPGGPGGGPSKLASRPTPQARPLPQSLPAAAQPPPAPQPTAVPRPVPQPVAAVAAASHTRTASSGSVRAPPPPPPASPPAPKKATAKVLYDFSSGQSNELDIRAGEIVQIVSKEGNGKSLTPWPLEPRS
jgi:myosin-1